MNQYQKLGALVIATAVAWLSVLLVAVIINEELVIGAAALMAVLATITIWSMWGLDAYGLSVDGTPRQVEKPKRAVAGEDDARLALLLTMLTPDERDAVRERLLSDLQDDGEVVTLAELLDTEGQSEGQTRQSS